MSDNLHTITAPILLLALFCGLHPLYSTKKNLYLKTSYKWISPTNCYCLLIWIVSLQTCIWITYTTLQYLTDEGTPTSVLAIKLLVQLGTPLLITPAFLYVSVNCPRSLQEWAAVERTLPPLLNNVRYRIYLIVKIIIVGNLVKHLILNISDIEVTRHCVQSSFWPAVHLHFNIMYPVLFHGACFPSLARVMMSLTHQMIMDLQWVCGPLLIITISRILHYWLDSLNSTLEHNIDQVMPIKYWREMRERYNNISRLTRIANNLLHPTILVCCLLETALIILHFYVVVNLHWESLAFIVTLAYHSYVNLQLLLSMSAISEVSRRPLTVLTSVPTILYNEEVSRFYDQVVYDHLALSGGKIFDISRTFIVNVVSTLITFEVMLLQQHVGAVRDPTDARLNSTTFNGSHCYANLLSTYNALRMNKC